jgi:hypothetical protein
MNRRWTDQPVEVETAPILCSFFLKAACSTIEVREGASQCYFTTGNLFGSQTLRVPNLATCFRLIQAVVERKDDEPLRISRFPGVEIIEGVTA